jgi:hypothetical protein
MQPVEVAVGADHLRLDPEAEIHSERRTRSISGRSPCRKARGIDGPVAKRCAVVAAAAEPAVVEDEALGAETCRGLGEVEKPLLVEIEISGFPGIEVNLAGSSRDSRRCPPRAKLRVERSPDAVEPVDRQRHQRLGRGMTRPEPARTPGSQPFADLKLALSRGQASRSATAHCRSRRDALPDGPPLLLPKVSVAGDQIMGPVEAAAARSVGFLDLPRDERRRRKPELARPAAMDLDGR